MWVGAVALDFCSEVLGIEVLCSDGGVEVALRGELDIATAPVLHQHLFELVDQGWTDIALDFAELRYIDSTGLSVVIMTLKRVEEMGALW